MFWWQCNTVVVSILENSVKSFCFIFILIIFTVFLIVGCTYYNGPATDHFDGSRFTNNEPDHSFSDMVKWWWEMETIEWPDWVEDPPQPIPVEQVASGNLRVTYINHATVLVQIDGVNVVTDPFWSERAGPFSWLGVLLIYLFAMKLGVLPASGYGGGKLVYLVLPAFTLAQASAAYVARITRSSLLDEIGEMYMRAARAKGVPERWLFLRHGLRNALLPIITVVGADFGSYLSGAVLTESIFAWPGLGRFTLDAILKRDLPAIQGSVLFMAVLFMTVNLLVDLLYARVDPRVKLGGRVEA